MNIRKYYLLITLILGLVMGGCQPQAADEVTEEAEATEALEATEAPEPTEEPAPIRIGLVLPDFTQNQLILDLHDRAVATAEELEVELLVEGTGAVEDQVAAVENYIAAEVDVLVYDTTDGAAMSPAIEQANSAGIPVVCVVSCALEGEHAAQIIYNYRPDMGQPLGEWIASVVPAGGKVGVVDSNQSDAAVAAIYDGMYDGLEGTEAEVEVSPPTNWDRAAALDIARDLLTANPDFDVVVGFHDLIAAATLDAMAELGYEDVPIAGLGGTCEGLANILAGRQDFTVIQPLAPAGRQGIEVAAKIARGEELESAEIGVPMIPLTQERAEMILSGSEEGQPQGVDVLSALEQAEAGC